MRKNGYFTIFTVVFLLLVLLLGSSCTDDTTGSGPVPTDMEDIPIDDDFDFATLQGVEMEITVKDLDDSPMSGVRIFTYKDPFTEGGTEGGEVLITGLTQDDGTYSVYFQVPSYLENLYVRAEAFGFPNQAEVAISGGHATYTFGGVDDEEESFGGRIFTPHKTYNSIAGADQEERDFDWAFEQTAANMSLIVTNAVIGDEQLVEGDYVGVFTPSDLCAGYTQLDADGFEGDFGIAAWGDDPSTREVVEGFVADEEVLFRLWDTDAGYEYAATAEYVSGRFMFEDGLYHEGGLAQLSLTASHRLGAAPDYRWLGRGEGDWDRQGVPNYLERERIRFDREFLNVINENLPEMRSVPDLNPDFIAEDAQTNLVLTENATVNVSFLHEGAGYRNALGYYLFDPDNPPESVDDIEAHTIIFPNASYRRGGGGLRSGDNVNLGEFDEGTGIGWFIVADGWNGETVGEGRHIFYSHSDLNPEGSPELRAHNVFFVNLNEELLVLGFEDLRRDGGGWCDHDFNDVIFAVKVNPFEAINDEGIRIRPEPEDSDGDGVNDVQDDYPDDRERAFNNYSPGENTFGMIAFEDLWPRTGDYDFNDLVVSYRFNCVTNADNLTVDIIGDFDIKAVGAGYQNGFGIELPLTPGQIASVEGYQLNEEYIRLADNGVEAAQRHAVLIIFDNTRPLIQPAEGYDFVNTERRSPLVEADRITVTAHLTRPTNMNINLQAYRRSPVPPFNPFLIVDKERGKEVHLADYPPTSLADADFFGTYNDDSDPGRNRYYKTERNLPWGLLFPGRWHHVIEQYQLLLGYPHFYEWATSGGNEYRNWYLDEGDNINWDYIWRAR